MGYLDNTSITVDAILTKRGRELLSQGGLGAFNITQFALGDDEIDYTLFNESTNQLITMDSSRDDNIHDKIELIISSIKSNKLLSTFEWIIDNNILLYGYAFERLSINDKFILQKFILVMIANSNRINLKIILFFLMLMQQLNRQMTFF